MRTLKTQARWLQFKWMLEGFKGPAQSLAEGFLTVQARRRALISVGLACLL